MNESKEREQSLQPMQEQVVHNIEQIGQTSAEKLEWLESQTPESFTDLVTDINATARCLPRFEHEFDGQGVQAGTINASIPPEHEDKILLFAELVQTTKQFAAEKISEGASPDEVWQDIAFVVPTVINKLHLFANGNGRTSRILRMTMLSNSGNVLERTQDALTKNSRGSFDTTPTTPVERSIMPAVRLENGTEHLRVVDHPVERDDVMLVDDEQAALRNMYPSVDRKIIRAHLDTANFYEAVRLFSKEDSKDGKVSLRLLFENLSSDPSRQEIFTQVYAGVRKQRVEMLIKGLYGMTEVPINLNDSNGKDNISRWINNPRRRKGLPAVDPGEIKTIGDFQKSYMDGMLPAENIAA